MELLNYSLLGKVAIVTGAASIRGIGRATALTLAKAGADVAVCDVNPFGQDYDLEGTATEVRKLGRRSLTGKVDISQETEVESFIQRVMQELGRLDILVNNAGVGVLMPGMEVERALWDKAMTTNIRGCHNCCIAASKVMKEQGGGSIINITSVCGMKWAPNFYAYGVSKAGIIQITRWLGRELAPYNIRVNAIAPGMVDTDINDHDISGFKMKIDHTGKNMDPKLMATPRVCQPTDIAGVALFLAADVSNYVTGQTIIADGGSSL